MNIIIKKTSELIPYVNNPRKISDIAVTKVASSIKEFGFKVPIIIGSDNVIVTGHTRLMAAIKIGMDEVPCIIADDLSEAQIKAFRIADNRVSEESEWDLELLNIEIEGLNDFDLDILGFDEKELNNITPRDEVVEDDYEIELPENPISKRGDIWLLGNHRVMCGDSTTDDVKTLMDGKQADFVFTDPPWNVNYGATDNPRWKQRTIMNDFMGTDDFKMFMETAFGKMASVSKEGCMTYVVMSAQEWGNMMLSLAGNGYHWSSTIIWNKDHLVLSRKDYHTKYEPIWYGWKDGQSRLHPLTDRKQSDVWDFDRPQRSAEHPRMKPIALVNQAIVNSSNRGNIVLDIFGGSGSTLIAAEQSNRKCYMMELDEKYVDVIVNRYMAFKESDEGIILIRDGVKIPYNEVSRDEV